MSVTDVKKNVNQHFCFNCGAGLQVIVLENRPREVCPACGWIHYAHLKLGAGVMIERGGKLLLLRRAHHPWQGCWNLPAGYVEADEAPEQAAVREALEETGLHIGTIRLFGAYFFEDDPRGNGLLLLYSAQVTGGEQAITPETTDLRYFAPSEIPNEIAGGAHDRVIRAWAEGRLRITG